MIIVSYPLSPVSAPTRLPGAFVDHLLPQPAAEAEQENLFKRIQYNWVFKRKTTWRYAMTHSAFIITNSMLKCNGEIIYKTTNCQVEAMTQYQRTKYRPVSCQQKRTTYKRTGASAPNWSRLERIT